MQCCLSKLGGKKKKQTKKPPKEPISRNPQILKSPQKSSFPKQQQNQMRKALVSFSVFTENPTGINKKMTEVV